MDSVGGRYSIEAVNRFLQRFGGQESKDAAMSEIQSRKVLEGFIETIHGRVLIDSVIDGIRKNMRLIIGLSVDGFDKNSEAIKHAALQIGEAVDFLGGIRTIYDRAAANEAGIANEEAQVRIEQLRNRT